MKAYGKPKRDTAIRKRGDLMHKPKKPTKAEVFTKAAITFSVSNRDADATYSLCVAAWVATQFGEGLVFEEVHEILHKYVNPLWVLRL
jgi:hypothetical protein